MTEGLPSLTTDTKDNKPAEIGIHVEHVEELDEELEKYLQTPILEGLSDEEVKRRVEKFGRNGNCLL